MTRDSRFGCPTSIHRQPSLTRQTEYAYNWIKLTNFDVPYRKTVGLIGFGRIGTEVARLLRPFRVETLYTKRNRLTELEEQELGVKYVGLDELLCRSDFVSLQLTFNQDNEKLMGKHEFVKMKTSLHVNSIGRDERGW